MDRIPTVVQEARMTRLKKEPKPYAVSRLSQTKEENQMTDCEVVFEKDHTLILGTNPETGLGEVRIIGAPKTDHDNKMRNLCIEMIFEAGRECSLLDAVHSAAEVLGTPKHILDSIVEWAGFDPMDNELGA